MNTRQAYIFDYGGTLDTGGHHWGKVIWHAYRRAGVNVTEEQYRQAYVYAERTLGRQPIIGPHFTFSQTLEAKLRLQLSCLGRGVADAVPPTLSAPQEATLKVLHSMLYDDVLRHTAHSRGVLRQLPGEKVLVSNFYGNISTVLHEFGFTGLFRQVVESAVVGVRKPDPRIFQLGVEALGLPPGQVVVVGDSMAKDIVPARQAGCRTVWLRGEQWTDDPVDASAADRVISDLSELLTTQ